MALTPEELRQRIPSWSLESDGLLLQRMISIAKNLENKCNTTRDNLNSLMLQVNQTEVKLANATNQFTAVEQVKFVENRVEEDDESFYGLRRRRQQAGDDHGKPPDPNATGEHERTLDDPMQLVVERSIEGMYKSYEKVTLQLDDSSDSSGDEGEPHATDLNAAATVMRAIPKYSFIERPLPHVIGTKEWQNKWHVGLIDSDDESISERKEEYSESPSETDDGGMFPSQPNSKNHTPSESESSIWGAEARKRAPSIDPSITGDDGSSVYSYASSSKVPARAQPVAARTLTAPAEVVAARLKPPALFPEEPPKEPEDTGRRRGLFDDSPEEEDEPAPAPAPTPTPQPRQTGPPGTFFKGNNRQPAERKVVNLFDDEPPEPLPGVPEPKRTINLFIESEDELEENVRNNNVPASEVLPARKPPGQALPNPRTMTKLVDELNNNFRKQTVKNIEPNGNPIAAPFVKRPTTATNLFDDEPPEDEFEQLFKAANPGVAQTRQPQPEERRQQLRPEKKTVNLFAEDDEDVYDGIVVGSNETKLPVQQKSPYVSPVVLAKPPERLVKKSIFDESDSEQEEEKKEEVLKVPLPKAPGPATAAVTALPKANKSIFSDSSDAEDGDDDEAALFGKSSSILRSKLDALKSKPPPAKSKSLFDEDFDDGETTNAANDEDENDLFGGGSSTRSVPQALDKKVAPKVSLFDDEPPSDDEDALFGGLGRNGIVQPVPNRRVEVTSVKTQQRSAEVAKETATLDLAPPSSIRSLIQKKSIFNSDSESEEDDSIFANGSKSVQVTNKATNQSDISGVELAVDEQEAREPGEKDARKENDPPAQEDNSVCVEPNAAQISVNQAEVDETSSKEASKVSSAAVKTSIFDYSSSENETETDPFGVSSVKEDEVVEISPPTPSDEIPSDEPVVGNGQLENASIEPDVETSSSEEKTLPGMIANDIDYYLHTNNTPTAAVKSEPKSALNFTPIGLFDDVPPPDDGGEPDDDPPQQKAAEPVDSAMPSIEDPSNDSPSSSSYAAETQSLHFIPTGSSTRSRYLFDDEPPPDEADNMGAGFNGSGSVAPSSLPPILNDGRTEAGNKPTRPKVNKLNTKIAINVAALLPGAKRPAAVPVSPPEVAVSPEKVSSVLEATTASKPADASNGEKLTSLNKGRARIPTKRKPPSRHSLRTGATSSTSLELPNESAADDRIVVGSEQRITEHIEASFPPQNHATSTPKLEERVTTAPLVDRLSASVRNPTKRLVLPDGTESATPPVRAPTAKTKMESTNTRPQLPLPTAGKSLFGDSDSNDDGAEDDFFSKLPIVKKPLIASSVKAVAASIFGSDDDDGDVADGRDDDLFGAKKSSIAGQLKAKGVDGTGTGSLQPPRAAMERKSLFGDEDDDGDDDDDLFGGTKSKTIAKVNNHPQQMERATKPASRAAPMAIVKPPTTTTHTVDDPLADLLAD
uniref:FAM21/CAPZIP domain-containing protein n=1 Tax=Anopheles dirus TaxID=7168 RepID=A0A182MZF6_9DIPT